MECGDDVDAGNWDARNCASAAFRRNACPEVRSRTDGNAAGRQQRAGRRPREKRQQQPERRSARIRRPAHRVGRWRRRSRKRRGRCLVRGGAVRHGRVRRHPGHVRGVIAVHGTGMERRGLGEDDAEPDAPDGDEGADPRGMSHDPTIHRGRKKCHTGPRRPPTLRMRKERAVPTGRRGLRGSVRHGLDRL